MEGNNNRVISLKKGKSISLKKDTGDNFKYVFTGLKWGKVIKGGDIRRISNKERVTKYTGNFLQRLLKIGPKEIIEREIPESVRSYRSAIVEKDVDLDSSILIYDSNKNLIDKVCYFRLKDSSGKIVHYGDDRQGGKNGKDADNEIIGIELQGLPASYKYMVVILNSYSHEKFDELPYISMRIYSSYVSSPYVENEKLAEFTLEKNLEDFKGKEGLVLGAFVRVSGDNWDFKTIGKFTSEKSIEEMGRGSVLKAIQGL